MCSLLEEPGIMQQKLFDDDRIEQIEWDLWPDAPEFYNEYLLHRSRDILVHFKSDDDRTKFLEEMGLPANYNRKYCWYIQPIIKKKSINIH